MLMGRFDLAAPAFEKAIEIEPTDLAYSNLGLMHYYLGDADAAIASHNRAVELNPNDHLARSNLGDALWNAEHEADAIREFETARPLAEALLQINPNDPFAMMDLSWIYAMLGEQELARSTIDKALELAPDDPYTHYYDAMVHLRAGDKTAALDALEVAVDKGYSLQMLAAEPHLAVLRDEPRFSRIVDLD